MADLKTRIINILKTPKTEWPVIAAEQTDAGTLYKQYIIPLAAIPPVCHWIGMSVIGISLPFGGHIRTPIMSGLAMMIVSYVFALAVVYIAAIIIEWLAPKFKSSGSRLDALKLVAYAYTPAWIAGVLNLIPALSVLALIAALYCIYLFYVGVTPLMKTPSDQVVPYMIVSALLIIVISIVLAMVAGAITMGGARTF